MIASERRKPTPYQEQIPGWPTAWPMEWQNCPFWQTVFAGPQAHGADDGCSALQDIAGGLGLATCRAFASAKLTDMAIARKLIAKVFSMVSSSLDDVGPDLRTRTKTRRFGPSKLVRRGCPPASFATGLFFHEIWTWQGAVVPICGCRCAADGGNGTELTV